MFHKFHVTVFRFIGTAAIGIMTLISNTPLAGANPSKPTTDTSICQKETLLKSVFHQQLGKTCLTAENPILKSNDSDRSIYDNGDKSTPDKSMEESTPASGDSHDFNLFKGNIIFQLSPGGGGDSFGNGSTSPEPTQPEALPIKPSKKIPEKPKGVSAKPQKLVSPKSPNPNQLLHKKGIKPISSKYSPSIKSLILPTKSVQPIFSRPNPTLRIRSVQPMIKQRPMINPGMSRPVQRRSK